jgi:hypothetical protein
VRTLEGDTRGLTGRIWLLAFAIAVLGAGVFVYSGSQAGILFVVAGVPLAIVTSVVLYVRQHRTGGTAPRSGTDMLSKRARQVGEQWADYLRKRERVARELPDWDGSAVSDQEAALEGDLTANGIRVDNGDVTLEDDTSPGLAELQSLQGRVEDLTAELDRSAIATTRTTVDRLDGKVDELERTGFTRIDDWTGPAALDEVSDANGAIAVLEEQEMSLIEGIKATTENIRTADEVLEETPENARQRAQAAFQAADRGDIEEAVDMILSATDAAETELGGDLDEFRSSLEGVLDSVLRAEEYLDTGLVEDLNAVRDQVRSVDSVTETGDLREARRDVRRLAIEAVRDLESALEDRIDTISDPSVPSEFHERPQVEAGRLRSAVEDAGSLSELQRTVDRAVDAIQPALGRLSRRANVVSAYPDVEPLLERRLDDGGELSIADIDLEPPELFLELYALNHDGVRYEPDDERLVTASADGGWSDER